MKLIFIITGLVLFYFSTIKAQNSSNYSFSSLSNGSLTDMSIETTQLIAPNTDGLNTGIFSNTNPIGFTFYFMSQPYDQFVVTEDGVLRLGTSLSAINRTPEININEPRLVPFSCDMATGSNGKVHYKVIGTAPNRICIIEWLNCYGTFPSTMPVLGQLTFQIRLYETTGIFEYVYGYMNMQRRRDNSDLGAIGFGNSNANNGVFYKTTSFSDNSYGTTLPVYLICQSKITTTGEVAGLSSTTDGARRVYRFVPPVAPAAPTGLYFTGISQTSVTLNWTDNATNETHYHIYRSDDGGLTYELVSIVPANSTTSGPINGLPDRTYFWKVYAVNEGAQSDALEGVCSTLPAGIIHSTSTGGLWSQTSTWEEGVLPGPNDDVIIRDNATVTIDITTAVCNNLTVGEGNSGHLQFIGGSTNATLSCDGDIWVKSGATFDVNTSASGGTRKLIIGQRYYSQGNLKVDGNFDMNCGGNAFADVEFRGSVDGTVTGSGPNCDFYSITVNKGTTNEKVIDFQRVITIDTPTASDRRLNIINGTFKLSSASTISPYFGTQTICSLTNGIWLNHPNAVIQCVGAGTTTGAGNATIDGLLRITAGMFAYGSGNNVLSVNDNGVLQIDGASGTLLFYGRADFSANAHLTITDGDFRLDPQAGNNLASGNVLNFNTTSYAIFTGGYITFVDPKNFTTSSDFYIPSSGEQNKIMTGGTIRLGDGLSSSNGSTNGFIITIPTSYGFPLGNIEINNPAGTNRFVKFTRSSGSNPIIINNMNLIAGTWKLNGISFNINGNITNNGMIDVSTASSAISMVGLIPQIISGSGSLSATNNLLFTINNANGLTLNSPFSCLKLTLTNGIINTTSTNILTMLSTTASDLSGGSATSYINGPFERKITTVTNTYKFPIGKSTYTYLELKNPSTSGTVLIRAEVFDNNCGGSIINPAGYELNTNRYWHAQVISGTLNNSIVIIYESNPTTNMIIAKSNTIDGFYDGTIHASQTGNSLTSSSVTSLGYFCSAAPGFLSGTYYCGSGQPFLSLTENTNFGFFKTVASRGLKGNVTLLITSDLAENGAVALTPWAEINGSGYTITIKPVDGTTKTISGNVSNGMIRLDGADKVTFDGSYNGSGKYLLFRNTNSSNPVFTFINEATYDTLKNILIESGNTTSTSGVILFSTSTALTSLGNSFNGIQNCTIRDRSDATSVPRNLIYSSGTAGKLNKSNTISNCNLFNFTSSGIIITSTGNGDNWTISNNNFYQTASRNTAQTIISIATGQNQQILNNYIGGSTVGCGSTAWTNSGAVAIKGISLSSGVGTPCSIQGNTIQNFSLSNASSSFIGIEVISGSCNIGTTTGNNIGDPNSAGNITLAGNTISSGIKNSSTSSVSIWNNIIGGITCSASNTANTFIGIWQAGTGAGNIANNIIANISSVSTKTSIDAMALQGIYVSGASIGGCYVTNNQIYNLSLTNNTSVQTNIAGISVTNLSNPIINQNKIWNLTNASTKTTPTAPPTVSGISIYTPAASSIAEIRNNMITLGNGANTNTEFNGIWLQSSTNAYTANIYFNSILISGTASGGALSSFALLRGNNFSTTQSVSLNLYNNIFANIRNGGTGVHYCIGNQGTSPETNWSNISDNNFYITPDIATQNVALWNLSSLNMSSFRTTSNGDNFSLVAKNSATTNHSQININNLFADIANGDLHINSNNPEAWFINGKGGQLTINNDIDGDTRSTSFVNGTTDIGCDEITLTSTPIEANLSGAISDGSTTTFNFGGVNFGQITWHGSNLPTSLNVYWYTQKYPDLNDGLGNPYSTLVGAQYSNFVLEIEPIGGDINTYTYDLRIYNDNKYIGTIDDITAISIAKNPYIYPTPTTPPVDNYGVYSTTSDVSHSYFEITDVIGFSKFIFYKGSATPLPVNLISFSARCQNSDIIVDWVTATELNNNYFILERSNDAVLFTEIAKINGAGNSNTIISYRFVDKNAKNQAINYYRLKQVDFDGKTTTSEIIAVQCNSLNENFLRIGSSENYISLLFNSPISGKVNVQIFDKIGRCVISKQYEGEDYSTILVDKQSLTTGIYTILVTTANGNLTKKITLVK